MRQPLMPNVVAAAKKASAPPANLDELVLGCGVGSYPWDRWQRKALSAGVAPELAELGRAVMREAYQHNWDKRLKMLCGWNDHGRCMMQQASHCPAVVKLRWQRMLDTDGYRGERDPQTGEWKSWP
ncbi:MAG: hypothetical protein ACREDS_00090 [Limisphaerales bacterium]